MSMSSSRMRMKSSRKILKKLSTTNIIVIENLDKDYDMDLENEMFKEENKRLKVEKIMMNLEKKTRSSSWRKSILRPV